MKFQHPTMTHGSVSQDETYLVKNGVIDCPEAFGRANGWKALEDAPPKAQTEFREEDLTDAQKAERDASITKVLAENTGDQIVERIKTKNLDAGTLKSVARLEAAGANRQAVLDAVAEKLKA